MSDSCFFWTQEPIGSSGEEGTDPLMRQGCANHVFIGSSIIQGYVNAIQTDTSGIHTHNSRKSKYRPIFLEKNINTNP